MFFQNYVFALLGFQLFREISNFIGILWAKIKGLKMADKAGRSLNLGKM